MQGLYKSEDILPNINLRDIIRALGYRENKSSPEPGVLNRIQIQLNQAKQFIHPAAICTTRSLRAQDKGIFYIGDTAFAAAKVSSVLSFCREVVIFLVTIGIDLENKVSEFIKTGEALASVIFDSAGSIAAELTADRLQENIRGKLNSKKFYLTHRYSPGYCDWDMQEQKKLFSMLPAESIGVELTESLMMKPRKSISGVFGILPKAGLAKLTNPCVYCQEGNCDHHRGDKKPIFEKNKNR